MTASAHTTGQIPAVDLGVHHTASGLGDRLARADEAHHRDVKHGFANELAGRPAAAVAAPYPEHADELAELRSA